FGGAVPSPSAWRSAWGGGGGGPRGTVHPHVRGARRCRGCGWSWVSGPSPRAWGSAVESVRRQALLRSIPTCVGLGVGGLVGTGTPTVHPHVRGARKKSGLLALVIAGPSPRAWGSEFRWSRVLHHVRSIPTCVGLGPPG